MFYAITAYERRRCRDVSELSAAARYFWSRTLTSCALNSLLPASASLIARKFSLLRRLGNSGGKRLNFLPKAEAPWLFQARNRRISLYFPVEQGTQAGDGFADDCLHRQQVAVSAGQI
jgi:hypothetical protein